MKPALEPRAPASASASALLDARALEFLHQSNAIEDITCLDYTQSREGQLQGHVAAFLHSQQLARIRKPVSAVDLCYWQQLIVLEQRQARLHIPDDAVGMFRSGFAPYNVGVGAYVPPSFSRVPELMQVWLRDLRARLLDDDTLSAAPLADLCGDMLQRFEAIHPFVDGNGRVGRLIVNYLMVYWQHPLLVVRADEREIFFAAHRSKAEMRQFMRLKMLNARALSSG
jgi:Fic family protein